MKQLRIINDFQEGEGTRMRRKLSKKQIGAMGLAAMMAVQAPVAAAEMTASPEATVQETTEIEEQQIETEVQIEEIESQYEEVETPDQTVESLFEERNETQTKIEETVEENPESAKKEESQSEEVQLVEETETELRESEDTIDEYAKFSDGSVSEVFAGEWKSINGNNIPSDALYYNGHYYAVFNLHSNWEGAKTYCESLGGYLATITSQEENDAVFEYMKDQGYDSAYFGYTDEETEGIWKWVNGENSDYTNWNPGEPNAENSKEDYAMFYYKYPKGTWNDGDFGGSTVGNDRVFICEWGDYTNEEQPKYALRPEQVWGFKQKQVSDLTGTLNLGYYTKFFNPAHAAILLLADNGSGGYCSGMVTSVNAISGYDCVPVSSFQVKNLSDITNPKTTSLLTLKSAADYIKYAHVYQNKSSVQKEAQKHNGDLNGLYNAVKNSVSGSGDYVEIRIRGDYASKINIGHCLLAMGIAKDTNSETEILVYDGNFPSDLKDFHLYKQNGQVISWKYDQSAERFVDWGTGKSNSQITYTTSGKDFKKDVTSDVDKMNIDMYKYLISVENKNVSVRTSNGSQSLKGSVTGDIIPLQTYNGTADSDANVYWIDTEGEISVQNNVSDNSIEVAGNNKTVSADISANSSVSVNLNNQNLKADVTGISSGESFSVTLTQYSNSAAVTAATVTGIASTETVSIQKESGNKVDIKGAKQAEIQFQKEDGSTTEKVKVDLEGKPSQIEQNTNKITVKQDSNGDGTYDKTVYDFSEATGQWIGGNRWWYRHSDGSYTRNNWELINGKWYFFDSEGWMVTGWLHTVSGWYYLTESGAMATGWNAENGYWYYLDPEDGHMHTGWYQVNGIWYCSNTSGAMMTGWAKINGTWYYMNGSGAMVTGWLHTASGWYYLTESGAMAVGWCLVGNSWYYMSESGAMVTGWLNLNGNWYYMRPSGLMAVGWCLVGNSWYYMSESGVMVTGWLNLNGTWYYMGADGAMLTGTQVIGGTTYIFNQDGAWVAN